MASLLRSESKINKLYKMCEMKCNRKNFDYPDENYNKNLYV